MPSLTPASWARSTDGVATAPTPTAAPSAVVCRKLRRLNPCFRSRDIDCLPCSINELFLARSTANARSRLPAAAIRRAGTDKIDRDAVTIRSITCVQMPDTPAVAVKYAAHRFDQRRAGPDAVGLCD